MSTLILLQERTTSHRQNFFPYQRNAQWQPCTRPKRRFVSPQKQILIFFHNVSNDRNSHLLSKRLINFPILSNKNLTHNQLNKLLSAKFLVCFNFQSASMLLNLVKIPSKCQTAWIEVRRRVTWHLIWIKIVCICHYSCE